MICASSQYKELKWIAGAFVLTSILCVCYQPLPSMQPITTRMYVCCILLAGEFYWMESVQSYNEGGWDYTSELRKFVEGGMTGTGFIDGVSGIVNRGCHNPVSRPDHTCS